MAEELTGRYVRESLAELTEFALPNDANMLGNLFGGKVMSLIDLAASLAAVRHARTPVVTASVDSLSFIAPVKIGELVILRASVNRVFRTSMEVGVKVFVENPKTGVVRHTSSAYLTFVSIDREGNRLPVGQVIPETEDEHRRYDGAARRREVRLELREKTKARKPGGPAAT